jgi:hypothetical protein
MFAGHLSVPLRRSCRAGLLLGLIHGGGVAGVWVADIPLWTKILLSLGVTANGLYSVAAYALRCVGPAVTMLYCDANDRWQITTRSGQTQPAVLLSEAYVHPLVTVMRFRRADGTRVCVPLLADALDGEDFRRLRARVRARC